LNTASISHRSFLPLSCKDIGPPYRCLSSVCKSGLFLHCKFGKRQLLTNPGPDLVAPLQSLRYFEHVLQGKRNPLKLGWVISGLCRIVKGRDRLTIFGLRSCSCRIAVAMQCYCRMAGASGSGNGLEEERPQYTGVNLCYTP
jgi:hypothetical protein